MNKSVGKGLASAIEKGEQATEKTKESLGTSYSYFGDTVSHPEYRRSQGQGG